MRTHGILSLSVFATALTAASAFAQISPTTDKEFAKKAAIGGMAEVETSKLAAQKASDAALKSFAERMVAEHTRINEALEKAASEQRITLPSGPDGDLKDRIGRLQGLSGKQFDDAYRALMVDDHKTAVALFEDKVRESPKTPIGRFAADTVQTLRAHRQMAEDLR